MNVYQLTAISVEPEFAKADGSMPTFDQSLGVFTSVENAEEMMRINGEIDEPWAYILEERILDDLQLHGHFKSISKYRSVRTYFGNGKPNAENVCDDTGENLWYGRDAETIRFKEGDFVSFINGHEISPGLVGLLPMTKDVFKAGHCGVESGDDCYLVYTADGGHHHPFTPFVFPLVGELSPGVRAKLEAAKAADEVEMARA